MHAVDGSGHGGRIHLRQLDLRRVDDEHAAFWRVGEHGATRYLRERRIFAVEFAQELALDAGVERLARRKSIESKCELEKGERSESNGEPPSSERMHPSDD